MSVFRAVVVRIYPHPDWIQRDTEHLSVFSSNVGKYGPEQFRIRTLFTQWFTFSFTFPCIIPVRKYLWKVCDIWRDIPGFTEYLTAWKVSKYRVFSGSYFPVFSSNTGICVPKKTPHLDTSHAMSLHLKSKLRQLLSLLLLWWWCRFIAFAQAVLNPEIFLLSEL